MAVAKILANFNLVVWYRIAIHVLHVYASKKFFQWILIWRLQRQTAKTPNQTPC